jgi:hypothetical protein
MLADIMLCLSVSAPPQPWLPPSQQRRGSGHHHVRLHIKVGHWHPGLAKHAGEMQRGGGGLIASQKFHLHDALRSDNATAAARPCVAQDQSKPGACDLSDAELTWHVAFRIVLPTDDGHDDNNGLFARDARLVGDHFGLDLNIVLVSHLCSPKAVLNICHHTYEPAALLGLAASSQHHCHTFESVVSFRPVARSEHRCHPKSRMKHPCCHT